MTHNHNNTPRQDDGRQEQSGPDLAYNQGGRELEQDVRREEDEERDGLLMRFVSYSTVDRRKLEKGPRILTYRLATPSFSSLIIL